MADSKPKYSRNQVVRSGVAMRNAESLSVTPQFDLDVANWWRSSHKHPLNTIYIGLNRHASRISKTAVVSQRLKRMPSIQKKLKRFQGMRLKNMQDIGGCRVVLPTMQLVTKMINSYEGSYIKHAPVLPGKDYIHYPKRDGYRSVHRTYKYYSDKSTAYNNHMIEIQYRTSLQHAWATAVEAADIMLGTDMKSGEGQDLWRRFFIHASNLFADLEGTPKVPYAPKDPRKSVLKLQELNSAIGAIPQLQALQAARDIDPRSANRLSDGYQLLSVYPKNNSKLITQVTTFSKHDYDTAVLRYFSLELSGDQGSHVLVSATSLRSLQKAYPNYFLDTDKFVKTLMQYL